MPDWSYHPLFRPLLFRLAPERGRDLALGLLGQVGRMPTGPHLIQLLGHMQVAPAHARTVMGLRFPGAVGVGDGFDSAGVATAALARFGVGFVEVGPVSRHPLPAGPILRDEAAASLRYPAPLGNEGVEALQRRLRDSALPVPLAIRLTPSPPCTVPEAIEELCHLVAWLAPRASFFTLDCRAGIADERWPQGEWGGYLDAVASACAAHSRPLALCLPPDLDADARESLLPRAADLSIAGILVGGGLAQADGARLFGEAAHAPTLAAIRAIRERWGSRFALLASGGSHAPAQALELLEAGADLVLLHSGLVFAGPGLPKRINEALAFRYPAPAPASIPFWQQGWLWAFLLGLGMIASGLAAWFVALTSVLLPYDEAFLGITRADLLTLSPRLLPFMAHDRVALAGTMVSIGILYACLAAFGLRAGLHWAWKALGWSGAIGFLTFFLFLGYGYFDPLHALLSVGLLPLFLLGLWQARGRSTILTSPNLHNDGRWLRGQWGQAFFVALGLALVVSGITIMMVGVTSVFVPEDLRFIQASREYLCTINPRLVPLVAHDRAGFGGALFSDGIAVLLCALWGFRQGARWLWWMLAGAGGIGFLGAIGIHPVVGYTDLWHLAPALVGLLLFLVGLALSYDYLCAPSPRRTASTPPV